MKTARSLSPLQTGLNTRSYLKKVFSPGIGVESLSQVLDILEYACGLILGLALISNENPNFEIASNISFRACRGPNLLK